MGADMLLACCEIPSDYESKSRALMFERIDNLDEKRISTLIEGHYILESEVEDYMIGIEDKIAERDLWNLNNLKRNKEREIVSRVLKEGLDHLFSGHYNRDTAERLIRGTWFIFSGGMSWGDEPTDSYHYIALIDDSGVTDGMSLIESNPQ
jgi:hypothetical protein